MFWAISCLENGGKYINIKINTLHLTNCIFKLWKYRLYYFHIIINNYNIFKYFIIDPIQPLNTSTPNSCDSIVCFSVIIYKNRFFYSLLFLFIFNKDVKMAAK